MEEANLTKRKWKKYLDLKGTPIKKSSIKFTCKNKADISVKNIDTSGYIVV